MTSAAAVLTCALAMLGGKASELHPIELVESFPLTGSRYVEAYVQPPLKVIYLVTTSPAFRDAQQTNMPCGATAALRKIASVIAHEEWHIRNGGDERGAYEAQLATLIRLGAAPDSLVYGTVVRSMQAVLKERKKKPAMVLAGIP